LRKAGDDGMKGILQAILLAVAMLVPISAVAAGSDYDNHWARQYISQLVDKEIMRGDGNGLFRPDANITRAEYLAIINRSFGFTEKAVTTFKDVQPADWFAADVAKAVAQGYFSGLAKGQAQPRELLLRDEAVIMLGKVLKLEEAAADRLLFKDDYSIDAAGKGLIGAVLDEGLVAGDPSGYFRPKSQIRRGEIAKIIAKAAGEVIEKSGIHSGGTYDNVTVTVAGIELRDMQINGNLYISEGVGLGGISLDGVTVLGRVMVCGAGENDIGENSIRLNDCDINQLVVNMADKLKVTIAASGSTQVDQAKLVTGGFLVEENLRGSGFSQVVVAGSTGVSAELSGDFDKVLVTSPAGQVKLYAGEVRELAYDETAVKSTGWLEKGTQVDNLFCDVQTTITGSGVVDHAVIMGDKTSIQQMPGDLTIKPGITVTIGGKAMSVEEVAAAQVEPKFTANYPRLGEVTGTEATMLLKADKILKVTWILQPAGAAAPANKAELLAKKNALKSGTANLLANTEAALKIAGLASSTGYKFYAYGEDIYGNQTEMTARLDIRTDDIVAPVFSTTYPRLGTVTSTSLQVLAKTDEASEFYWLLLPKGTLVPVAADLLDGIDGYPYGHFAAAGRTEKAVTVSNLTEMKDYDCYIMAVDGEGNQSKVVKLSARTADITAPSYIEGFPYISQTTAVGLSLVAQTDESCKLYWAAVDFGAAPPASGTALTRGYPAVKSGNSALTLGKPGTVVISGLKAATSYDIYLTLLDASNNASALVKYTIRTVDTLLPAATLTYSDDVAGQPTYDADIVVNFSEIVRRASDDSALTAAGVLPMIKLYDITNLNAQLAYTATVSNGGNRTAVSIDPVLDLYTSNSYQLVLNGMEDTSGNPMAVNYKLPFNTVPATVEIRQTYIPEDYHLTFTTKFKNQQTSAVTCYDTILEADQNIKFNLSWRPAGSSEPFTGNVSMELLKGVPRSLQRLLSPTGSRLEFYPFNTRPDLEYAMTITALNYNTTELAWDGQVNLKAYGIVGNYDALSYVSSNVKVNLPLKEAARQAAVISSRTYTMTKTFVDKSAPSFTSGYPVMESNSDVLVNVGVKSPKNGTVYWILMPRGAAEPTVQDVIDGGGGDVKKAGSVRVTANFKTTIPIAGLNPGTAYDFIAVIEDVPMNRSEVVVEPVETVLVAAPQFIAGYPQAGDRRPGGADVRVMLNKDAKVHWVVFLKDSAISPNSPEDVINKANNPYKSGTQLVNGDQETVITVAGLVSGIQYKFYCVAVEPVKQLTSSITPATGLTIMPQDTIPPSFSAVTSASSGETGDSGTLVITFSERLYYKVVGTENVDPIEVSAGDLMTANVDIDLSTPGASAGATVWRIDFSNAQNGSFIIYPIDIYDVDGNRAGQLKAVYNKALLLWEVSFIL